MKYQLQLTGIRCSEVKHKNKASKQYDIKHLTEEEQFIFQLLALLDTIRLYQAPNLYNQMFQANLVQVNINKISPFAQCHAIEQLKGTEVFYTTTNNYSQKTPLKYFTNLGQKIFKKSYLLVLGMKHAVGVVYEGDNLWSMMNVNRGTHPYYQLPLESFISFLFDALRARESELEKKLTTNVEIMLTIHFICLTANLSSYQKCINDLDMEIIENNELLLHEASWYGAERNVLKLLNNTFETKALIDAINRAINSNQVTIVKILLSHIKDKAILLDNEQIASLVSTAILLGHGEIFEILFKEIGNYDNKFIINAVKGGYLDIYNFLIKENANIQDLLPFAIQNGHIHMVDVLLKKCILTPELSAIFFTAISNAVNNGHLKMLHFLIDNGLVLKKNEKIALLNTLLQLNHISYELVKKLDGSDYAMLYSALVNNDLKMATTLIDTGLDPFLHFYSNSAIEIAIQKENKEIVELILKGKDLSDIGANLLCIAIENGLFEMTELLIKQGINPNLKKEPLKKFFEKGECSKKIKLSDQEALGGVNFINFYPQTKHKTQEQPIKQVKSPLYVAAEKGYKNIFLLLISAGAYCDDPSYAYNGKTLAYIATIQNHHEMVQVILNHNPFWLFEPITLPSLFLTKNTNQQEFIAQKIKETHYNEPVLYLDEVAQYITGIEQMAKYFISQEKQKVIQELKNNHIDIEDIRNIFKNGYPLQQAIQESNKKIFDFLIKKKPTFLQVLTEQNKEIPEKFIKLLGDLAQNNLDNIKNALIEDLDLFFHSYPIIKTNLCLCEIAQRLEMKEAVALIMKAKREDLINRSNFLFFLQAHKKPTADLSTKLLNDSQFFKELSIARNLGT